MLQAGTIHVISLIRLLDCISPPTPYTRIFFLLLPSSSQRFATGRRSYRFSQLIKISSLMLGPPFFVLQKHTVITDQASFVDVRQELTFSLPPPRPLSLSHTPSMTVACIDSQLTLIYLCPSQSSCAHVKLEVSRTH